MYGWEFPPHISGGLGTACFGLTQALVSVGHRITFVLPKAPALGNDSSHVTLVGSDQVHISPAEMKARSGFCLETVDSPLSPYINSEEYTRVLHYLKQIIQNEPDITDKPPLLALSGDYGVNLMAEISRYASVAGKIAKKVAHEVIHVHDWITIPAGIEAQRVSRRPLVVHIHSLEYDRCGENVNPNVYEIERRGMEQADGIISVSHLTKTRIVKQYGISPDKITVIYNGITRKPAGIRVRTPKSIRNKIVLFLGRITFQKGPDYFVEAAAKVLSVRQDVTFVMVGSGDMMNRMITRTAELKIGNHFYFPGFLRGEDVAKMYSMSDLYVMPSVSEPFGISPLEAMEHGVPVIISRQSGVAEVVGSVFKVDFWDTRQLAGKMLALLHYPELGKAMIHNGARELDGITWEKAAESVAHVYNRVAAMG